MKALEQMEELEKLEQPELDEAEEEEIDHPYLETIQNMDTAERMNKLRSLVRYSKSDEWKKVKESAKTEEEDLKETIKKEAYNRTDNPKKASVIDERVLYVKTLTTIAEKVDNEVFKDYLLRYQVNAYESFVLNKVWHVFLSIGTEWSDDFNAVPVLADEAIYTKLDMLKKYKQILHSTGRLLAYCIETYDIDGLLRAEQKEDQNPHQPY